VCLHAHAHVNAQSTLVYKEVRAVVAEAGVKKMDCVKRKIAVADCLQICSQTFFERLASPEQPLFSATLASQIRIRFA
jgi:hypothetical protein